jgi:AraC family transcriptional regulator, regulatory protein of adaptative response / DNA-3-methyladenine glycosylase II
VPWSGPELVCRAVQLILGGELDRGGEADLGRRLGVSARHLRRLFGAHLGVSPDGLARSARAHFARRLLDDTELSVTEVAFAAGFGSLRQFNRVCREVFRGSPGELRARRRAGDRLVADGGLVLRLPFAGPLDWAALAGYLGERAIPGVESVAGASYRRTVVVGGDPGVLELFPGGDDQLLLRVHLPHWAELIHIVERARRIASLDLDLDEPCRQLAGCATIGPLVRARPGLRPPGSWDPFETGVRAIIGQRLSVAAANTITGRLVERLGQPVPGLQHLGLSHTFPSPATLAGTRLDRLRLPPRRAEAIRSFAAAVRDDQIRLDRSVTLERLIDSITTIDGLGPRTAHYLALRLGEPDAYPAPRRPPHPRHNRAAVANDAHPENWRPWRALAATHLWAADPTNRSALAA